MSRHNCESSHASSDTSSGTRSPISAATDNPATAMMSLSYTIAVGRSGGDVISSDLVALAPASPEKSVATCHAPASASALAASSKAAVRMDV